MAITTDDHSSTGSTEAGASIPDFEAPGPGGWMLDTTHHGCRPLTRFMAPIYEATGAGFVASMSRYGLPLERMATGNVNGYLYMRPMPVGEGAKPGPAPPAPIMKVLSRIHPGLRRRNRAARDAWTERRWRADVDEWFEGERAGQVDQNVALQGVDLVGLDDAALVGHVDAVVANFAHSGVRSFETHGGDIMPVGDYLAHCAEWGIDLNAASALLTGASPASIETREILQPVVHALAGAARAPTSVAEVRALGPDAAAAVDTWLDQHGARLVGSDDIDAPTLGEMPEAQLTALLSLTADAPSAPPDGDVVRARVPEDDRVLFDELLAEARHGLRLRDDSVGVRWQWPAGLIRRALLEVGSRLAARGVMSEAGHAFQLDLAEVGPALDGSGPAAAEIAGRVGLHEARIALDAPLTLGPEEEPPPVEALPKPLGRATGAMLTLMGAMEGETDARSALHGVGIGTEPYRGPARVVTSPTDAFDRLEPGDVLVTAFTGPAYNSLLPIVGALAVELGGPMCHAAIVAREFGLPAVIGARGATTAITDGQMVEVDPVEGVITVLS